VKAKSDAGMKQPKASKLLAASFTPQKRRFPLLSPSWGTVQMPNASWDTPEACPKPLS